MFQQPNNFQFTEWKCGMRKQEDYQQCSAQNLHHSNFPNRGKYNFGSLINQVQHSNIQDYSNRLTSPSLNQSIQPHSIATVQNSGINRVTKFIPPLKQEQRTNVYINTNQMSCGNSNQMVPIFQNTSRYNGRSQMNNSRNVIQPNLDATVTQSNFSSRIPPSPNPDRNVNERYRKFDKMTADLQNCESMLLSRSSEEVFNKSVQFERANGICGSYGNPSKASIPQLPRSIPSAALPVEAESAQMLSLTLDETRTNNNLNYKIFGCTEREKMFVFTGTVEKIMKWNKIFRNHFCYFEVIGVANFNSKHGCLKCTTVGEYSHMSHTVYFPRIGCEKRTNDGFRAKLYGSHHKQNTPLSLLPIDMVEDFPVGDSLHLIDLGVMKRCLLGWRDGSFGNYKTKWCMRDITNVSHFLENSSVVSIQEGSVKTQKVMLLRDRKGPVLQVVYYLTTHLDLRDFHIGQMVRCVGKMSGQNVFNAVSIRGASEEEVDNLQRLCLICDQAVSHYLNV